VGKGRKAIGNEMLNTSVCCASSVICSPLPCTYGCHACLYSPFISVLLKNLFWLLLMSLANRNAFCVLVFLIVSLSYNPQFSARILTRGFPRGFAASSANAANHCVVNTSRAV